MSQTQTAETDEPKNQIEDRLEDVEQEVEDRLEDVEEEVEQRIEEVEERVEEATEDARENLEERVEDAIETVDDNVVDVGSQVLDTTARADVYVALRSLDGGDAEDVAEATGLYPEKVEEVLNALEDEGVVEENAGDYTAVAPTELVRVVGDRITETVNDLVENGRETLDETRETLDDTIDENRQRIRDSRWSPFRLVDGEDEEAEATEIPIEG